MIPLITRSITHHTPSGIEAIQITEHMGFNLGNAIKYVWRADLKADALQDLEKAVWYIQREIAKRKAAQPDDDIYVRVAPQIFGKHTQD